MTIAVQEIWDIYADVKLGSLKSAHMDRARWTLHLEPLVGSKRLDELKTLELLKLRAKLEAKGLSPQTVKHCLALLRRLIKAAVQWELYSGPLPKFEMPKINNERTRFLVKEEACLLLNELAIRSQLWHDISLLALTTGMRASELFRLTPEHISLKSRLVHIHDGKSIDRTIPLNTSAMSVVNRYYSHRKPYLFTNRNGQRIRHVSNTYSRSVEACTLNKGVTDRRRRVVFHTLRHTFASWLVQSSIPLAVVSNLLGHKDIKMTMRYAHLAPDQGAHAVALLEKYLSGDILSTGYRFKEPQCEHCVSTNFEENEAMCARSEAI